MIILLMEYKQNSIIDSNNDLINLIDSKRPFSISRLGIGQETVTTYHYWACGRLSQGNVLILA